MYVFDHLENDSSTLTLHGVMSVEYGARESQYIIKQVTHTEWKKPEVS